MRTIETAKHKNMAYHLGLTVLIGVFLVSVQLVVVCHAKWLNKWYKIQFYAQNCHIFHSNCWIFCIFRIAKVIFYHRVINWLCVLIRQPFLIELGVFTLGNAEWVDTIVQQYYVVKRKQFQINPVQLSIWQMYKDKYESQMKSENSAFFDRPRSKPFRITEFIYNKREGTVLGRNTESWSKLATITMISAKN